ncbi:MAG: D-amino acid dehydrogenase [Burkholderiales bacterium]|nr:D-amino acid dehydrogenase [Burkholderiales bacterium]
MKVLVLGAGVIGVTTAHYLVEDGHEVEVVDRQGAPARETSFANAGSVCPSYATPWAAPGMRRKALAWLLADEAPLRVRWRADAALARWGFAWLRNCSPGRFAVNKSRMQRLSHYSLACLQALRAETGIRYDETTRGVLQLLRTPAEIDAVSSHTRVLAAAGIAHRLVDAAGAIAIEPALAHAAAPFEGGLHLPNDESGDCRLFTERLAERAAARGAAFRFGTWIERIETAAGAVTGVATSTGHLSADRYVVALGVDAARLLAPLGLRLPIQPVRGFSVTLPLARPERAPLASVIDEHTKVAITRMGDRLRAAGAAELGVDTTDAPPDRFRAITRALRELFPQAGDFGRPEQWAGLRPMTPDGPPLLGPTPVDRLLLNVGHGGQGWSMACGSARVLADLVAGRPPGIDLDGLTLARYS